MARGHAFVQGFSEPARTRRGNAHCRENHTPRQRSGKTAGQQERREGVRTASIRLKSARQRAEGRGLEREYEEQRGPAERAEPGILHDLQPPGRGSLHDEPVPAVRHAVKMQPSRHGDPDKAADDAAQGGGQELCRKAEREGYEHADDEPDHGQPDGDAPERGRQRRGTDGQAGEEAEGGAEHHFMPMPCSVFISVRMRTAASMIG